MIAVVTIMAEIWDLRRLSPRQFMGYLGLVPVERSPSGRVHRLGTTIAQQSFRGDISEIDSCRQRPDLRHADCERLDIPPPAQDRSCQVTHT